jgi:hypothetical protein
MTVVAIDAASHCREQPIGWESRNHHREKSRVRRAYADWLNGFDWHHYVDLTSKTSLSEAQLLHTFEYRWIRWLERSARRSVRWSVFAQEGKIGKRDHLHCLLYGTSSLTAKQLCQAWQLGITRVRVYDRRRGAAGYITRDVLDGAEWNISRRLPPKSHGFQSDR